jgi:hypothetical protein
MEELERKKVISEIWHNWVIMISIAVAGLWASYSFWALKEVHRVESKQVALEFNLEISQVEVDQKGKFGIETVLKIKNNGIRPVDVDLSGDETFTISRLGDVESTNPREVKNVYTTKAYNRITLDALRELTSASVYPGVVSYFMVVDDPGLYFVSFISEIPEDVLKLMTKQEVGDKEESSSHPPAWGVQKYLKIHPKS